MSIANPTPRSDESDISDDISTLYAVGAEGDERWRFTRSCEGFSRVAVTADTVFVGGAIVMGRSTHSNQRRKQ